MQEIHKEESTASKFNFSVWKDVFRYLGKHWVLCTLFFVVMICSSLAYNTLEPLLNNALIRALDSQTLSNNWFHAYIPFEFLGVKLNFNLVTYIITLFSINLLRVFFFSISILILGILNSHLMVDLRRDCFKKIQELSFSYFDKTPSGWLIARAQSDTQVISDTFSDIVSTILWAAVDMIFACTTMFLIDWRLALIVLAIVPILLVIVPYFEKKTLRLSREVRAVSSNYLAWVAECITGHKTIKALNLKKLTTGEARDISEKIRLRTRKLMNFSLLFNPIFSLLRYMTISVIIIVVSLTSIGGGTNTAVLIATMVIFFGFIVKIFGPMIELVQLSNELLTNQPSLEKVFQLLKTDVEIADNGTKLLDAQDNEIQITFEDVHFSYIKDVEVLHGSSFVLKPGTSLAIVGETGSGKSTTVNLLCRFYEPTAGRILINGVDYREYSLESLRRSLGYVQQSPVIFTGTIADNIKYGKLNATLEEVIEASKSVDMHEYIMSLPKGYDTIISADGGEISTGQKQLLSFARAIIRNPSIMVLDEATASIDTETELIVQSAVEKIMPGRTTLMIAHRLSTIIKCDRILVMKNGLVVEDGSHLELMRKNGYYHELYMNQFAEMAIDKQIDNAGSIED